MEKLKGKKVVVMGLGRFGGGVGVARYLSGCGADVLVTDMLGEEELGESVGKLEGYDVRYRLGEHVVGDFVDADMVVVNPAVDPEKNEYVRAARAAGVALTSEIKLLIERLNRKRVIGITGTAGKSTTTALLGHILKEVKGEGCVYVGGNIGGSLLGVVDEIGDEDWVVLELSSFMLEGLGGWSPGVALVTNISDNHLDRHVTMEAYADAKKVIMRWQDEGDVLVLGPSVHEWGDEARGKVVKCGEGEAAALAGAWCIPGKHNRMNALMAVVCAEAVGVGRVEAVKAGEGFKGLAHRLEMVGEVDGVRYYNDSKSTTPASAMLAIDAFEGERVHVILGGYDKKADLRELGEYAGEKCVGVYTMGETGGAIAAAAGGGKVYGCETLEEVMACVKGNVVGGDVVVMSPGCASWDQFKNYESRGELFRRLALGG